MLSLNRLTGAACAIGGLLLLLVVIPDQIEVIEANWVQPATVPKACAWIVFLAGAFHTVWPGGDTPFDWRETLRAGLFLAIACVGVYLISEFGFVYVAPGLALVIMLVMGERRAPWLVFGTAIPVGVWAVLEFLLERPLP